MIALFLGLLPLLPPFLYQGEALVVRTRATSVMGTELHIEAHGPDSQALDTALDAAVAELRRVEDLATDWRPSPLETLNGSAGKGPQTVPPELFALLERGRTWGAKTAGAFDISFGAVGRLYDLRAEPPVIPDDAALAVALGHVGWDRIRLNDEENTVALPDGMRLGLGGIAKGYGVDRAIAVLRDHGVEHAIVSAGGDLKALGLKQGKPWRIAIRHPRNRERVLAVLPVSNRCVVTSGDYERFFEVGGVRYHHILDPHTGRPATGCMSATVVGPDAADCDALATALCVLGPERGLALIEKLPGFEALLVDVGGEVLLSRGLMP